MDDDLHRYPPIRSTREEQAYLTRRAEAHRHLAEKACETESRAIHLRLTRMYEEQAEHARLVGKD